MSKNMLLCFVFGAVVTLLCACGTPPGYIRDPDTDQLVNVQDPPVAILTIHPFVKYPRGLPSEMQLNDVNNEKVWVKARSLFHSSVVRQIYPVMSSTDSAYGDLRLKLSPRGERWWNNMIDDYYGQTLIIALDGQKIGSFVASESAEEDHDEYSEINPYLEKPGWVRIPGPFHESLIEKICSHSRKNYLIYYAEEQAKVKATEKGISGNKDDDKPKSQQDKMDSLKQKKGSDMFKFDNLFDTDMD